MKEELKAFFSEVASDPVLQKQLYQTKEIADVAHIAKDRGFEVTGIDILRAQAGRILMLIPEELEILAAGKKPQTGAQWGREGNGYLDNAGFWLNKFIEWDYADPAFEPELEAFFIQIKEDETLKAELLVAKTCNDIATIACNYGYKFAGSLLVRYQAIQVLKLTDEKAEKVANGTI